MAEYFTQKYPFKWCKHCCNQELYATTMETYHNKTSLIQCENEAFCRWLVEQVRGEEE